MTFDDMKQLAAEAALDEVRSGMTLGLGTGSTAEHFVRGLAARVARKELSDVRCVATSDKIDALATSLGIDCGPLSDRPRLDLAVDGADEIDPSLRLIKGHGGALLREKIVAQAAARFIVIADHTKKVTRLGSTKTLPVEVVRFAARPLVGRFDFMGLDPSPRVTSRGEWFRSDEGHHIIDVRVPDDRDVAVIVEDLRRIAGVVETGFFADEASAAILAGPDGLERLRR